MTSEAQLLSTRQAGVLKFYLHARISADGKREEEITTYKRIRGYKLIKQLTF